MGYRRLAARSRPEHLVPRARLSRHRSARLLSRDAARDRSRPRRRRHHHRGPPSEPDERGVDRCRLGRGAYAHDPGRRCRNRAARLGHSAPSRPRSRARGGVTPVALGLATLADGTAGVRPTVTPGGHDHERVHVHAHPHGRHVHTHAHGHDPESHPHAPDQTPLARLDRWLGALGTHRLVRPLIVGIVHGLAGSAAVALLVLATIRDPRWSMLYLGCSGWAPSPG